ncbi:YraN family protein [Dokdonella sp.]|uniref:YraN family protein n=1 Tax=Dokdonella sp. TaxID=2291710 RepID=UPI001B25AB3E|nr:YraN family protein [Dokdonella sp.]MBO9665078.1 YraN family protein [Dokdonella sp.]
MKLRAGSATQTAGAHYEDLALAHLQRAGLALIERNFSCRWGEIDLVMREGEVVVFVEVRYRRGAGARGGYGSGIDSVGATKRAKLVRAAEVYLAQRPRLADRACRFDVLAIAGGDDAPEIDWRRNAFEAF